MATVRTPQPEKKAFDVSVFTTASARSGRAMPLNSA